MTSTRLITSTSPSSSGALSIPQQPSEPSPGKSAWITRGEEMMWIENPTTRASSGSKATTLPPPMIQSRPTFYAIKPSSTSTLADDMANHRSLTSFRLSIFMQEFILQILGPLSWPFCHYLLGPAAFKNRLFHIIWGGGAGQFVWALAATMQVLYFISSPPDVKHVFPAETVISTCIMLSRITIIAARYSYMSPADYRETCERALTFQEIQGNLLVRAWGQMSPDKINGELQLAIERSAINIQHVYLSFIHENQAVVSKRLTQAYAEMGQEGDEPTWWEQLKHGKIHAQLLLRHIFVEANQAQPSLRNLLRVTRFLALLHALIPCFVRLSYGWLPFGNNAQEAVIIGASMIVVFLNFSANVSFIGIGILDFNRRIYVMHQLSAMLTSKYQIWQTKQSSHLPIMDLTSSTNFANWMDLRCIAKNFGLNFFLRIQAYSSLWCFFLILFVAYLLIQVVFSRQADLVSIILAVFDVVIVATVLLIMLSFAKTLNHIHDEHHLILLRTEAWLQRQCDDDSTLTADGIRHLKHARSMIETVTRVVDREDRSTPVTILGFPVSNSLLRVIVGVVSSGLLAGARLILT